MFEFNEEFFISICFFIFVAAVFPKGRKAIASILDNKIKMISANIEEATKIRAEAMKMLEEAKLEYTKAVEQRDLIAKQSEKKVKHLLENINSKIQSDMKRDIQSAHNLAARNMDNLIIKLKSEILQMSIEIASAFMKNKMCDEEHSESVLNEALSSLLSQLFNTRNTSNQQL